jgi:hypothetical protein
VVTLREGGPDDGPVANDDLQSSETPEAHATGTSPSSGRSARIRWAQLLARGHRREALVARCCRCCARAVAARCGSSPSSPIRRSSAPSWFTSTCPTDPLP